MSGKTHFEWYPFDAGTLLNELLIFLCPSFLDSHRLFPDMSLTLIPCVSLWWDDVSPTLTLDPTICSSTFNIIHLNPLIDLPLMPKYSSYFLPRE